MIDDPIFKHENIKTNGINLHFVTAGTGPAVILCHGFPESWYSWRHQIIALAEAGYRVIAPDMRGFGQSDAPAAVDAYTRFHVVGDLIGLIDLLEIDQAVVVGHDWGTEAAWGAGMLRPDRFHAVVGLSVPFLPRAELSLIAAMRATQKDSFYMLYFQQPGLAEKELEADTRTFLRKLFFSCSGDNTDNTLLEMSVAKSGRFIDSLHEPRSEVPWMTKSDLDFYVSEFERTGFTGALNTYRSLEKTWELSAAWHNVTLNVPALFITGAKDIVCGFPGMQEAIHSMKLVAPLAKPPILLEGVGHWVQNEAAQQVNSALLDFLGGLNLQSDRCKKQGCPD